MDQPDWDWKSKRIHSWEEFRSFSQDFHIFSALLFCQSLNCNFKYHRLGIWDMNMTHDGTLWLLRIMKWMMIMWRFPIRPFLAVPSLLMPISQKKKETEEKKILIVQFIKKNLGLSYALLDSSATFISFRYLFLCNSRNIYKKSQSRWNESVMENFALFLPSSLGLNRRKIQPQQRKKKE